MASEQFSLCWDNFHKNMSSGMNSLLENEDLVDVTLAVEGKCLKAHKMVLSVCSPYFKELFKSNPCQHPIVFMKDVSYVALSDLLQFMYQGEVQVSQENLTTFIKTAEALQIKGLTGDGNGSADTDTVEPIHEKPVHQIEEYKPAPRPKKQPAPVTTPSLKRPRLSVSSSDSQPLPAAVAKTEPIAPASSGAITETPVQFKMEPYDQSQSLIDETGDENFGDDNLDDTNVDDTEDYSMMEGGVGEEEPQAGTSTDGAGEGQDEIEESWKTGYDALLPKSRARYEKIYAMFREWLDLGNVAISEKVLLAYFIERSKKLNSPASLWTEYSMLKTTIKVNDNINIGEYHKLAGFLKKRNVGHKVKKSKVFTREEMNRFLTEAPDDMYLMMKVVMIMGIAGACRREELTNLTIDNVEDKGTVVIVKIPNAKTNICRIFTITDESNEEDKLLHFFRKYVNLRPKHASSRRFFYAYRQAKCVNQVVGINTIGKVPQMIAQYLKLKEPYLYTGHSFRRTSKSLLANMGIDVMGLK